MADKINKEAENLKGFSKYFNSVTIQGRANVAKTTYALVALISAYYYLKPKKEVAK